MLVSVVALLLLQGASVAIEPGLIERLRSRDAVVAEASAMEIAQRGPEAVPTLVAEILRDSTLEAPWAALRLLGRSALPPLRVALADPSVAPLSALLIADVLGPSGPSRTAEETYTLEDMAEILWQSPSRADRILLERVALSDRRALEFLAVLLVVARGDTERQERLLRPEVRMARRFEVRHLERAALNALIQAFVRSESRQTVVSILQSLTRVWDLSRVSVPADVWRQAIAAGILDQPQSALLPIVRTALVDEDSGVRTAALLALTRMQGEPGPTLPEVVSAVGQLEDKACPTVISPLASRIKDRGWRDFSTTLARAVVPLLRWPNCGSTARSILVELMPQSLPVLVEALRGPDRPLGWAAVGVFSALGRNGAAAAGDLGRSLASPDVDVRRRSVAALVRSGRGAAAAIEPLVAALADPDICWTAATALGQLGALGVPRLIEALKDPRSRTPAVVAIGKAGRAAEGAVDALRSLSTSGDPDLASAVTAALARLVPLDP